MTDREQQFETAIHDYLDDQLSTIERQEIEDQLAEDPQARQQLEELQLIRSGLRQLPSHQLGDAFASEVMEQADLAGSDSSVGARISSDWPKFVAWGVATAAAAVLAVGIGIYANRGNQEPGQGASDSIASDNVGPGPGVEDSPAVVPGGDPVKPPRAEETNRPGTVNVDTQVANQLMLVMEIGVTEKGVESKVIDKVLMKHGIVFDNAIQVDMELEKQLLENRFLDGIVRKPSDPKSADQQVELIYVVCGGRQFDEMSIDLHNYHGEVAAYRFNLVIMPADTEAFGELEKAIATQWTPDSPVEKEQPAMTGFQNRAGRLLMDLVLISGMGRSLSSSIISSGNDLPALPPGPPKRGTVKPPRKDVERMGDNQVYEILLVVRTMSTEEIEQGSK